MLNHNLQLHRCDQAMDNICIRGKEGTGRSSLAIQIAQDLRMQSKVNIEIVSDDSFEQYRSAAKDLGGIYSKNYCLTFNGVISGSFSRVANRHRMCLENGWKHISEYDKGKAPKDWVTPVIDIIDCCYVDMQSNLDDTIDLLSKWNQYAYETSCYYIIIANDAMVFSTAPLQFQTIQTYDPTDLKAYLTIGRVKEKLIRFEQYIDSPRH